MQERLTSTSFILLGLLEWLGEASPYDLKQALPRTVGNFWSVPHSQLYREADRLEAGGMLSRRDRSTPGGRPRMLYSLKPAGAAALARWRGEPAVEAPQLRDPGLLKLFFGADPQLLAAGRLPAHRAKLAEYEVTRQLDAGTEPRGPWLALEAGIAHEREWIRYWSSLARRETGSARGRS
jgi:PadR family transcriptional regulator, regulatory protein AphA